MSGMDSCMNGSVHDQSLFIIVPTLANTELLLVLLTLKSTAKFPKPGRNVTHH